MLLEYSSMKLLSARTTRIRMNFSYSANLKSRNIKHWTPTHHLPRFVWTWTSLICCFFNDDHVCNERLCEKKKKYKEISRSHSHWHLVSPLLHVIILLYTRNHLLNNTPNIVSTIITNHWIYHFNLLLLLTDVNLYAFNNKTANSIWNYFIKKSFSDWKSVTTVGNYIKNWVFELYSTVAEIKG